MGVATKYAHLFTLTDDTGIFQHSLYSIPDPSKGYTTDDNARAAIAATMLYQVYREEVYLSLLRRYLSFLIYAQNEEGFFKNFMNYNREFTEKKGSEDCFGRSLWALGYLLNVPFSDESYHNVAIRLLEKALFNVKKLYSLRGKAYSLIGLSLIYNSEAFESDRGEIRDLVKSLSQDLLKSYYKNREENWKWFEDQMTYSNAILPWSLLKAYTVTKDEEVLRVAKESMDFLGSVTFKDGYFKPIGCKGWYKKGGKRAEFDEQPIEACESALMYIEAYRVFGEEEYLNKAKKCYRWFLGENSQNISLVDEETGGCYDGITEDGVNLNEGAESLISLIMTDMVVNHSSKVFK